MRHPPYLNWRLAPIAAAAVAGALALAACGGAPAHPASAAIRPAGSQREAGFAGTASPSTLPTAEPSMSGMPTSAPAAPAGPAVAANAVTIDNFAFGPAVVTVKPGTTVHWTNRDSEAHTVTSDTGVFSSAALPTGAGFSYTFTKPGTYKYHCSIHPFMIAMVVVS
jgi:plastocyanin